MSKLFLPLSIIFSGLLFGSGMVVSGMVFPENVMAFLDVSQQWDPSLIVVMIGAVSTFLPVYFLIVRRMASPVFADKFSINTKNAVDKKLIYGSMLFGVGWGLSGICPGPAVASLAMLQKEGIVFILFAVLGALFSDFIWSKNRHDSHQSTVRT